MRILAGQYKGKRLFAGSDLSIRPTTNRIKDIIFAILDDYCPDKVVLDLFSGSGGLGLETLSRGARIVTFVEQSISSIHVLQKNLLDFGISKNQVVVIQKDVAGYIKDCSETYDLILMDPPFPYEGIQQVIDQIVYRKILRKKGVLVVHHEINKPLIEKNAGYQIYKQKKIGRSLITFILQEQVHVG